MAAGFQRFHGLWHVQFIGRGNGNDIQFFVPEHIGQRGVPFIDPVSVAHIFQPCRIQVRDRHNFSVRMGAVAFNVSAFPNTKPHHTAAEFTFEFTHF